MGQGSMLLENSQILKGENVPPNEIWAGLPASSCHPVDSLLAEELSTAQRAEVEPEDMEASSATEPTQRASLISQDALRRNISSECIGLPTVSAVATIVADRKVGMAALKESAMVALRGVSEGHHVFLVEWLWNGHLCLWCFVEESATLAGHLRIKWTGEVDVEGGRGPFAQFVAEEFGRDGASAGADVPLGALALRSSCTGRYLSVGEHGRLISSFTPSPVLIEQLASGTNVALDPKARAVRRRQEAQLFWRERRQQARYALQAGRVATAGGRFHNAPRHRRHDKN